MATSRHKKRILRELAGNPAWRVDAGAAWLCPYCGEPVLRRAAPGESPDEAAAARALGHFEHCRAWREFEGRALPLAELHARASAVRTRETIRQSLIGLPSWQLYDVTRRWYCPFCAKATGVTVPEGGRISKAVLREIERHLVSCEGYERGKGAEKPVAYLKSMVAYANRTRKMAEQIRHKIETDAAWRLRDAEGRWVCPYCRRLQDQIDFSTPLQMVVNAPLEIARHLIAGCERFRAAEGGATTVAQSSVSLEIVRLGSAPSTDLVRLSGQPPDAVSGEFPIVRPPAPPEESGRLPPPSPEPLHEAAAAPGPEAGPDAAPTPALGPAAPKPALEGRKPGAARRDAIEASLSAMRSIAAPGSAGKAAEDLAPLPDVEGIELRSFFRGAHAHPFDFADAILLDGRRLAIVVGGVSGGEGGPPRSRGEASPPVSEAGLVPPMVRNLFRMHAKKGRPPGEVLRRVNADLFADLDAKTFVSVLYGILDIRNLVYRFARAGTNAPVLYNPRREPDLVAIESAGMVLGIDRGPVFEGSVEEREVRLEPQDMLVQFTHGSVSGEDLDGNEIGLERFHDLVRRYGRHEADYFCSKFASFFEDWTRGAPLTEDACLLALQVKP